MSGTEIHKFTSLRVVDFVNRNSHGILPAYFALVMATGVVAIACQIFGYILLAQVLFTISVVSYSILWSLNLWRLFVYPQIVLKDFCNHRVAPGFFTIVAATSILGSEFLDIGKRTDIGLLFWYATLILALGITYPLFTALIVGPVKPSLEKGLDGSWLIAVVAWQSVSVLGGQLAPFLESQKELVLFISLLTWLFGGVCYTWVISLIFYRYMFYPFEPRDLSPPYWINMGAVAIATLAGTGLAKSGPTNPLLADLMPFLKGVTLLFWATATWWIPMLILLGIWRHGYKRFPVAYNPLYWGAVFPLGMYSVCTYHLSDCIEMAALKSLSIAFFYIASAAWLVTFVGMIRSFLRKAG